MAAKINRLGSSGILLLILVDLDIKVGQEARTTVQDNVITIQRRMPSKKKKSSKRKAEDVPG
jgi:hypothetical protein